MGQSKVVALKERKKFLRCQNSSPDLEIVKQCNSGCNQDLCWVNINHGGLQN